MTVRCTPVLQVAPQAWRNGGGRTREMLAWPSAEDWTLRISLADIDADGPFSAFPGAVRWFAVVEGAGVALAFGDAERVLVVGDDPLRFDAAQAPACRLLDGPTRDLNLMFRHGDGIMRPMRHDIAWDEAFAMRGLFAAAAGQWTGDGVSVRVARHTLVWTDAASADATPWSFVADESGPAVPGWWLGYTPSGAHR